MHFFEWQSIHNFPEYLTAVEPLGPPDGKPVFFGGTAYEKKGLIQIVSKM